ncbi:MAG: helix-turn-helix transcriptional regulator [Agathobacter sp.]|nr:helix-turn-helix transcriptional regulator [Agathobacter sp.]
MQVNIGEKIKELRKKNGRKQEELATALGVTPQAISRWEANGGQPDIGMIPSIANYFHITIDELFGYNNDRDRIIQEYNDKAQRLLNNNGDMTECIALLRRGLEEFPDRVDFKTKLACALNKQGWKKNGEVPNIFWEEATKLYEELLAHDQSCIIPLISIYSMLGKHEKAEKKASEQPDLELCKQVLLGNLGSIGSISDDIKAEQYRGEAVLELLHAFRKSLDEAIGCNTELMNSWEGLEILLLTRQLFEKIVGTECYGFHSDLCFIDMKCVRIADNIGDYEAAMDYFDSAFEHYIKFEQWKNRKRRKWEEVNDESRKNGNSDEHFTSSLLKSVNPASGKVIVCEPRFLEMAIHSFPEEKKKIIIENPKYSCIFNC